MCLQQRSRYKKPIAQKTYKKFINLPDLVPAYTTGYYLKVIHITSLTYPLLPIHKPQHIVVQ